MRPAIIRVALQCGFQRLTVAIAIRLELEGISPGDLICYSRERYKLTYEKLPMRRFIGHCDIVVARDKALTGVEPTLRGGVMV